MIKPIQLGSLTLDNNLIQAPLAGVSCAPFRVLATQYGHPGFCCTEMISAKDLTLKAHYPTRYLYKDKREDILCYQLSGDECEHLKVATQRVVEQGADLIDLNCGCPKTKIRAKNCGSKHLENPAQLEKLLLAIRLNCTVPVSMKIRLPTDDNDNTIDILKAAENAGIDFITVHGRNWKDDYTKNVNLEKIANIVHTSKLPIIANGDAADSASVYSIFKETNCAGIMIARASVGQPWLFEKIRCELSGLAFHEPSLLDRANMFIFHIKELIKLLNNEQQAILQSRKFAKYYARDLPTMRTLCDSLNNCNSFSSFTHIVNHAFKA